MENALANHHSVSGLYKNWYIDYASYVILERAIPNLEDGLKPVQRRILHAMKEMDDGRFNKVANIVGQSMQYHPHGDASINDAIVKLGQKNILIETQGNWGDVRTGDAAAASRYIEARLSTFASEVVFSPKITAWGLSYDGRKKEPLALPIKFPLLLAQGALGIAAGFATTILPHNFCELIQASIKYLKNKPFELYPDFETGGSIDVENYNDGKRGGKIICRARIEEIDKKTLAVKDLPYGVTTSMLCDSIVKANDKGKIKIKKVTDNTAENVEIQIDLMPGIAPDITMQALYAFTDCQVSISPNACVIHNDKPVFLGVTEMLKNSTEWTKQLLQKELEVQLKELEEDWHYSSLEKIFIEQRIYRNIEDQTTWEGVIGTIHEGLEPFKKKFKRTITDDDVTKLTEIKIKRISKFDAKKADQHIKDVIEAMAKTKENIDQIVAFTISFFENLLKKYGKGRERKTDIKRLDNIEAKEVALANTKIFVNKKDGFIGIGLKNEELIGICSTLDDVIVLRKDGVMMVTKVAEKTFVGNDILHASIFKKNDERTTYHLVYVDGKTNLAYVKRFHVTGITRDKEYLLITEHKNSKLLYLSVHQNGEEEEIEIVLSPNCNAQKKVFAFNFKTLEIKNRGVLGNQLSKYPVRQIKQKKVGASTLAAVQIWYHQEFGKLFYEEQDNAIALGQFKPADNIFIAYKNGTYEIVPQDNNQKFDAEQVLLIEKFDAEKIITALYKDAEKDHIYIKRFKIETTSFKTKFLFIKEGKNNEVLFLSTTEKLKIKLILNKKPNQYEQIVKTSELPEVSNYKSVGIKIAEAKYVLAEQV